MPLDICGLGNALMDVLVQLDDDGQLETLGYQKSIMSLLSEVEWQDTFHSVEALPRQEYPGGSCANAICTAALLGAATGFCGQVGDDGMGREYAEALETVCGHHYVNILPGGHTGKCLSLVSPDAERTMLTTLGCAPELMGEDLPLEMIAGSKYLHLTGYSLLGGGIRNTAYAALETARAQGVKISFDAADPWVVKDLKMEIWALIKRYADVVFVNEEEARALCDGDAEEAAQRLSGHCAIAVVKLGSRGALIQSGAHQVESPVFSVQAVDTTGAGDAFAGAFLYALSRELDLERCAKLATRVAAETVSQTGAVVIKPGKLAGLAAEVL